MTMKTVFYSFLIFCSVASSTSAQTLIFVGDTQSPTIIDKNRFVYNNNDSVRKEIYTTILELEKKDAVIHLGDITALADTDPSSEWSDFDMFKDSLTQQKVPLLPVTGNHEYMLDPVKGIANFTKRFPERSKSFSVHKFGALAVIIVNDNFDQLSPEFIQVQDDWYRNTINNLEADSTIQYFFVCSHHPPFTNNSVTGPDSKTKEHFWDIFFESKKSVAYVSGHSHAFEHFIFVHGNSTPVNRNNRFYGGLKHTIVSGGGGGIQHPLLTGKSKRYEDIAEFDTEIRPFHFLRVSLSKKGLLGEVVSPFNQGEVLSFFYMRN